MKITYTLDDARLFIASKYDVPVRDVEIPNPWVHDTHTLDLKKYLDYLDKVIVKTDSYGVCTNKLQLIKDLRDLSKSSGLEISLVDAKSIIERIIYERSAR